MDRFIGLSGLMKDRDPERNAVKIPVEMALQIIQELSIMRDISKYRVPASGMRVDLASAHIQKQPEPMVEEKLSQMVSGQFASHKERASDFQRRFEQLGHEAENDRARMIARYEETRDLLWKKDSEVCELRSKIFKLTKKGKR